MGVELGEQVAAGREEVDLVRRDERAEREGILGEERDETVDSRPADVSSGKSTVLTAIWTLLEAAAPPPTIERRIPGHLRRAHPPRSGRRARPHDLPRTPAHRTRST